MSQPDRFATQAISTLKPIMNSDLLPEFALVSFRNWTIKARVTYKSSIKKYNHGRGKLFVMYLYDGSAEIKAVAFNEECEEFYHFIQEDEVYYINGGNVTSPKEKFVLKIRHVINFTPKTRVMHYEKDASTFPYLQYSFTSIKDIHNTQMDQIVDVIGVCQKTSKLLDLTKKATGGSLKKKEVALVDQSGSSISLILWNEDAISFDGTDNPVVVVRFAVVSEFRGQKELKMRNDSFMRIDSNIPEALQLRQWFDGEGSQIEFDKNSPSSWITIGEADERELGFGKNEDFYNILGSLNSINCENMFYKACPREGCSKKITEEDDGLYKCEKCNQKYSNYKYRFVVRCEIRDCSGEEEVTLFNDTTEDIVGKRVDQLRTIYDSNMTQFSSFFENVLYKIFLFRIRSRTEKYNDAERIKSTLVSVSPINYKSANAKLIKEIQTATGLQLN